MISKKKEVFPESGKDVKEERVEKVCLMGAEVQEARIDSFTVFSTV